MLFMVPRINIDSKFHIVLRQHGREVLNTLRQAEKTVKKIARWENHKKFNVRCVRQNISPTGISLNTIIAGIKADKIIKKAEKQLLKVRIRQCTYTINKLAETIATQKAELVAILQMTEMNDVTRVLETAHAAMSEVTKRKQMNKFERLNKKTSENTKTTSINTDRWVINCSDRIISDAERTVLGKGLNFAVTPTKFPVAEIIAITEVVC
eukprot:GHVU01216749.1.p2 GENE.GHVU01216749.1~~GHVU01216749.1.p2  ORF type:complete len:210 (+),score=16.41 GHVU01216749.1:99-728(+)